MITVPAPDSSQLNLGELSWVRSGDCGDRSHDRPPRRSHGVVEHRIINNGGGGWRVHCDEAWGEGNRTDDWHAMHGAYGTRHRNRHCGGMSNKTPPPTEFQIPATVTTLMSMRILWYGDCVGNTTEENPSIFSLIRFTICCQQRHMGSKTLLQQNLPLLNWICWLTQVVLYSVCACVHACVSIYIFISALTLLVGQWEQASGL